MLKIKTVTVVGVTGTMGANIAGIYASFGALREISVMHPREPNKYKGRGGVVLVPFRKKHKVTKPVVIVISEQQKTKCVRWVVQRA